MTGESCADVPDVDPAAIFAAALSVWQAVHRHATRVPGFNLSEAYDGVDEFMRVAMRLANRFEEWANVHVAFKETDQVWPYLLEEQFGDACLAAVEADALAGFDAADCLRVAWRLKLPLRADERLPVPVCVTARNPAVDSAFREFRIQTFRCPVEDEGVVPFTAADEVCDDDFGLPEFGLYGVDESGLLEHIADRRTYRDAVALARKLAPGLELPECPVVRRA